MFLLQKERLLLQQVSLDKKSANKLVWVLAISMPVIIARKNAVKISGTG